jgi:hypothetical protein
MNTYKVFYNGKNIDISATSSYDAHVNGVEIFKVPRKKRHMVSVVLLAVGDTPVIHSTAAFG